MGIRLEDLPPHVQEQVRAMDAADPRTALPGTRPGSLAESLTRRDRSGLGPFGKELPRARCTMVQLPLDMSEPRMLDLGDGGGIPGPKNAAEAAQGRAALGEDPTEEPRARSRALFDAPTREDRHAAHVEHGRKASKRGRSGESEVTKAITSMRDLGIADLSPNRPGWRVIREFDVKKGRWVVKDALPVAKGTVDFEGCLRGGRFVRLEVKTVKGRRMNLRSYVTDGEAAALDRGVRFGALALLLVIFPEAPGVWYVFEWETIRDVGTGSYRVAAVEADPRFEAPSLFLERYATEVER